MHVETPPVQTVWPLAHAPGSFVMQAAPSLHVPLPPVMTPLEPLSAEAQLKTAVTHDASATGIRRPRIICSEIIVDSPLPTWRHHTGVSTTTRCGSNKLLETR